ncbi:hypothetical protein D6833_05645 [Candidatus Parcubacteria bacterium]|nr:MAG: hypothetical protein D6833_05645 [Candidatus Parcubacteria bacterium]
MRIRIELPQEAVLKLITHAVRERRTVPRQAEVTILRALELWEGEQAQNKPPDRQPGKRKD